MTAHVGVRIPRAMVVVLDLDGDVCADARAALEAAYADAAERQPRTVVLNLSHVDYIDSSGIALLVGLLAHTRREGRELAAYGLSDHYQEIFAITRLAEFITVHEDESSALGDETVRA
jgi:anti-sigma B factor antagonist